MYVYMYNRTDRYQEENQGRPWYKVTDCKVIPLVRVISMDLSEDPALELQPG